MSPRGPAERSERLGRTEIVTTALEVLDEHGLPGLSMRRIGDSLDVQQSALYWHFPNKQSLLAAVSDRILGSLTAETWLHAPAGRSRALGSQLRTALLARRDGAELVSSSFALDLMTVDILAMSTTAAHLDFDLDAEHARACAEAVVHYTLGHAFHEQQRAHGAEVGALRADSHRDPGASFLAGLELITAGAATLGR